MIEDHNAERMAAQAREDAALGAEVRQLRARNQAMRALLSSCAAAMRTANANCSPTDWSRMISAIERELGA